MSSTVFTSTSLLHLLSTHFRIESGRKRRAEEIHARGWVVVQSCAPDYLEAKVSGNYDVAIDLRAGTQIACTCPDYQTRGQVAFRPCKHILALALEADAIGLQPQVTAESSEHVAAASNGVAELPDFDRAHSSFADRVSDAIDRAIGTLSDSVETVLLAGEIPFLIGPTGTGKTTAVRRVATRNGWGFEEVAGSESWADADLLGLRTDHMEQPGVFARAFARARNGETVLLFVDEALRFNTRAHDLFMRPFQATPVPVAQAMGIDVDEPIRLVEAPLWGVEWAPVRLVHLVLAANPWGSTPDPALIRRVWPLPVDLDERISSLFDTNLADAIRASWNAVRQGELPLPIEYQALGRARHPGDAAILRTYLMRLAAVDRAAAEGFSTVLEGMGIEMAGGN